MDFRPSTFKAVRFSDKNFDFNEKLLQWHNECDTDTSNIQSESTEDTYIQSEHNTNSEEKRIGEC